MHCNANEFKDIVSETSQAQKATYCVTPSVWNVHNRKILREKMKNDGCQEKQRVTA